MYVRRDQARNLTRAASAVASRHRDVLLAANRKRQGKALHSGPQANLPQDAASRSVEGVEHAVEIARESHASGRRKHSGQERSALLVLPELTQRSDIVGGELADVSVRSRHLPEPAERAATTAAAFHLVDHLRAQLQTALAQRYDQTIAGRVVAHRGPVLAAFCRRTPSHPLADALLDDIVAIVRLARAGVDGI